MKRLGGVRGKDRVKKWEDRYTRGKHKERNQDKIKREIKTKK